MSGKPQSGVNPAMIRSHYPLMYDDVTWPLSISTDAAEAGQKLHSFNWLAGDDVSPYTLLMYEIALGQVNYRLRYLCYKITWPYYNWGRSCPQYVNIPRWYFGQTLKLWFRALSVREHQPPSDSSMSGSPIQRITCHLQFGQQNQRNAFCLTHVVHSFSADFVP